MIPKQFHTDTGCDKPAKCLVEREREACQKKHFSPKVADCCQATFSPCHCPDEYRTVAKCQGLDLYKLSECEAEKSKFKRRRCDNGFSMEPNFADYTNVPFGCATPSASIFTRPGRNPPPPPEYGQNGHCSTDPILWVFGAPYTY